MFNHKTSTHTKKSVEYKYDLILCFFLFLHSVSRTFYSRDSDSIDTYTIGFFALVVFFAIARDYLIKSFAILYLVFCLIFANDTYFSTASWNYLNIGNSVRLGLPIISFYGDVHFSDSYKNMSELLPGSLLKAILAKDDARYYYYFYRIFNIFIILFSIFFINTIVRKKYKCGNSNVIMLSLPLILAFFILIEGALGHYVKHSLGLFFAFLSIKYLDDMLRYDTLKYWLGFCVFFILLCLTVETYPVIILAIFGSYTLFSGFKLKYLSICVFLYLVFGFVLYFIYGLGGKVSFSASPEVNFEYIQTVVYGHPYKFYIGIAFYTLLLLRSYYNLFWKRCAFNSYDVGMLSSVVILFLALSDVRLSPILVVFHRFIYFLLIYGLITGSIMSSLLNKKLLIAFLLAGLSINKMHHLFLFSSENPNFKYDAVLPTNGKAVLPFIVLDEFSKDILPDTLVYLDEKFTGHSVVNYWFNARPFYITPGLISSISREHELRAENNLMALKDGRAYSLAAPPDYMVTLSSDVCVLNEYTVKKHISDWYLCTKN